VNEVLWDVRQERIVTCTGDMSVSAMSRRVEELFQTDLASPIILSTPFEHAEVLASLISHLTDYGIVDRLERRYPQVDRVSSSDGKIRVWLTLLEAR
jgi:hypothetical protein